MLQQTQADRVAPRFAEFIRRWPDPPSMATEEVGKVIAWWSGLGYNRRALWLHRTAAAATQHHGGRLPADLGGLMALPGVGPYTARAVMAFAHEVPVGVVDTNVHRVVVRAVAGCRIPGAEVQRLADELVPPGNAWDWNQAMLDLGATVCTARQPTCALCPVRRACAWTPRKDSDPAQSTVRQSRFDGSDRQGRGRLVAALRAGPISADSVAVAARWPDEPPRAARVAAGLVAEGLVVADPSGTLSLPV